MSWYDRGVGRALIFYHHHLVEFPSSDLLTLKVGWLRYGLKRQVRGDLVTTRESYPNQPTVLASSATHHFTPLPSNNNLHEPPLPKPW